MMIAMAIWMLVMIRRSAADLARIVEERLLDDALADHFCQATSSMEAAAPSGFGAKVNRQRMATRSPATSGGSTTSVSTPSIRAQGGGLLRHQRLAAPARFGLVLLHPGVLGITSRRWRPHGRRRPPGR